MNRTSVLIAVFIGIGLTVIASDAASRNPLADYREKYMPVNATAGVPGYAAVNHRIGRTVLCVSNNGTFGGPYFPETVDYFTNEPLLACEFPKGSDTRYLSMGAFWIGAVVDRDTLVSMGTTGWYSWVGEFTPVGNIQNRSTLSRLPQLRRGAVSEEDYVIMYADTVTAGIDLDYSGRPHRALNIDVIQKSYAWSYDYTEDFILFDYNVRNIGTQQLTHVYMGFYVDADVYFGQQPYPEGFTDDLCGFIETFPASYGGCEFLDTVNIAWIADNDGDPIGGDFGERSVPNITGTRIVRTPADSLDVSFNWWISNSEPQLDFGPRERSGVGRWPEPFRDFGTGGVGTPEGDANAYYIMRNMEFDYDQIYTAQILPDDPLWLYPLQQHAGDYADGFDTRYLLSFGPFNIDPGEQLPISFAYVAGENFHTDPDNLANLPYNPDAYYANVDFSDLALNAAWAGRIYDNPGVDTDGDGYFGKVRICCQGLTGYSLDDLADTATIDAFDGNDCELFWYEGDGVPDFRGASPPPAPRFWLEPQLGAIHVRINGTKSETTRDYFTGILDFEGYRIYIARDDRESSYSILASYDIEDYDRYMWTSEGFVIVDMPLGLDSLRCLYGTGCDDTTFHPLNYGRNNLYYSPTTDSVFYFTPHDYNADGTKGIRKTYPQQPYPSHLNPDSAGTDEVTADGYLKYFEYEFAIENLLPTVPYWITVTAFDFGSPEAGMSPLETSVTLGTQMAYAQETVAEVAAQDLKVYLYPNPYRADGNYRNLGFEGRMDQFRPDDRVRAIHFANLPARCTIRIYSLDGDLIREFEHDVDPGDPTASHDEWDLITRNTQMVVSGLYYWTVESEDGEVQIGKLVIIM